MITDDGHSYIIAAAYPLVKTFSSGTYNEYFDYEKINFVIYEIESDSSLEIKAWGSNQSIQGIYIENNNLLFFSSTNSGFTFW